MGELWIPEAADLKAVGSSGVMDGKGGPRATMHVTVSKPGSFDAMHGVLTSKASESHVLYDMQGDRLGQYFALNRSARALMGGDGTQTGISHNKHGTVNIQIELCWDPRDGDFTAHPLWAQPRPRWEALMRAVRSWGIDDRFIYRTATSSGDRANVERSVATWLGDAGGGCWWGHCHYDELETHWDPGPLNGARFFGTGANMADITTISAAALKVLWNADVVPTRWSTADDETNPTWGVAGFLGYLGQWVLEARNQGAERGKALAALATQVAHIHDDVESTRLLAEKALAQAQDNGLRLSEHATVTQEAIEAGVRAGLQAMIDSVDSDTTLLVQQAPEAPGGVNDGS